MKKVELLSPAGDLERLKIALLYGADAVYIGGKDYSLRANATNFSIEEIKEACDFAHSLNKKVYLTLNIIFHNEDIIGVYDYIKKVVDAGIDAFIISDLFLVTYIKKNYPNVEIHISTQNSTSNIGSVKYLKSIGADRVVLARELSKNEIKEIIDETNTDIEVFIHGAMCTFYSGRCVLSNYCTNRDSNRGGCSQVCRFAFDIDDEFNNFTMATKDLNMSYYLKDMLDIGIRSLKIEGRMRSIYYLATVISSYRRLIDAYYNNTLTKELIEKENKTLDRVANRDTSTHYFMKEADLTDQYYSGRQEVSNQDFLGLVIDYDKETKMCTITQRNYFKKGDNIEIFTPDNRVISLTLDEFYNEKNELLDCARHPEEIIKFKVDEELPIFSMMRIKL
jgi:putative protease